jgi:hypothetical protein
MTICDDVGLKMTLPLVVDAAKFDATITPDERTKLQTVFFRDSSDKFTMSGQESCWEMLAGGTVVNL